MSEIWERINEEFKYDMGRCATYLIIKRATSAHYVMTSGNGKYPAALFIHVDEFGDIFSHNMVKIIEDKLNKFGEAVLNIAVEVD